MILEVDNKKVFATDGGNVFDKKKHTIILLHGSGLSNVVWSLTDQYLSNQGYNVLAFDLPGHGNSEGECLKNIEDMSEWLNKTLKKIQVTEFSILGHSQGCLIALDYAHKYPQNLKNLIFVGGSFAIPVNQDLIDLARSGDMKAINLMMKWGYGDSKRFIGGNPVQKIVNSPREVSDVLSVDLIACNNYKNGIKATKSIKCPTLFIFGEIDKMITLSKGKEFASLVPNSKTHVIKNCGHMIMFENAFEMREKVVEFLIK